MNFKFIYEHIFCGHLKINYSSEILKSDLIKVDWKSETIHSIKTTHSIKIVHSQTLRHVYTSKIF